MSNARILAVLICIGFLLSLALFAAEKKPAGKNEEHHHAMAVHMKDAMEHAKILHHHAAMNADMNKKFAEEETGDIDRDLNIAKLHLKEIESRISESEMQELKMDFDAISKGIQVAELHDSALKKEIENEKPNPAMIKKHAAAVHHELKNAEMKHQNVMKKLGVSEPEEPIPE